MNAEIVPGAPCTLSSSDCSGPVLWRFLWYENGDGDVGDEGVNHWRLRQKTHAVVVARCHGRKGWTDCNGTNELMFVVTADGRAGYVFTVHFEPC